MKLLSISIINANGTIEKSAHEDSPEAIQAVYHIEEIIERWKQTSPQDHSPFQVYATGSDFYYYLLVDTKHGYLFISNEIASSHAELTRHFNDIAWIAASSGHKQQQKLKEKLTYPDKHFVEAKQGKEESGSLRDEFLDTIDTLLERKNGIQALFKKS